MAAIVDDGLLEEFETAFSLLDKTKTGELDAEAVYAALRTYGLRDLSKSDAKEMVEEGDLVGDGAIDFEEFSTMMAKKLSSTDPEDVIIDAFRKFDWKGTGSIPTTEFSEALTNLGDPLTSRELREMLEVCERDGQVYYLEFVKAMFGQKAGSN
eukprot:TRINITY_DN9712_c0_g1_i1.p1 TRINITY_DN9712_c0_g1~~TRINITY_DN9712_c0_g1_i1.p1  ORF type:complete len:154 (-),score=55.93 TRINITY_DN9712_c0_g1_i1:42-503(-)